MWRHLNGAAEEGRTQGIRVDGAPKGHTSGTHRQVPPQETVERVRGLMPVMGITRVANVTGLDTIGIPVVMVCRPNARSVSVSQGKGLDLWAAKSSGLMEAIEGYHAERICLPVKLGCFEDLRFTHGMIDVDNLPRPSDSRYTPFTQLVWIEGHDLLGEEPVWLPYELVHQNYVLPFPTGHGCFVASSNGLASGNHFLEAVSHGICEVVERDSTTLWHLLDAETQDKTRIAIDTVDDPSCRAVQEKFAKAGVLVAVWDTTTDIGIPSFLCRILQDAPPASNSYRPATGMGCHPAREIALLRALTEAAQSRLTFISGGRDDLSRAEYDHFLDAKVHAVWRSRIEQPRPQHDFRDVATWQAATFEEDVAWELERLEAVGVRQVAVVDLTKSEFGIPVVRVVIPGLEGLDHSAKFVPGERARARLGAGRAH